MIRPSHLSSPRSIIFWALLMASSTCSLKASTCTDARARAQKGVTDRNTRSLTHWHVIVLVRLKGGKTYLCIKLFLGVLEFRNGFLVRRIQLHYMIYDVTCYAAAYMYYAFWIFWMLCFGCCAPDIGHLCAALV